MQRIEVDRVMAIAAEAFARHGFTGVGMREVSRQCGVSLPTLYYYFGSKEKLFEAVCRDCYRQALEHVQAAIDPASAPPAQMERLAHRLFDLLLGDQTLFLLLRRDLIEGSRSRAEFRSRHHYEGLIEILRRALGPRYPPAEVDRIAFTAAALIFGFCEFVVVSRDDAARRRDDLVTALMAILES